MRLLARLFGGRVRAQIEEGAHVVGMAIYMHLYEAYAKQYGHEKGVSLAIAVTNELFGAPPGNEIARAFLALNRSLVDAALRDIKNEPRICYIVSVITHMRANVAGNTRTVTGEMGLSWVRLRELGVLLPIDQIQRPTSPEDLMQQAREFEQWVVERAHENRATS